MVANPDSFVGFSAQWVWVEPALVWVSEAEISDDASDPALYADYLSKQDLRPIMEERLRLSGTTDPNLR